MSRPTENPAARPRSQIFGDSYTRPDSVSAATWNRPYQYIVVRTDDDRLSHLDDHPAGRTMSAGLHTRHNAVGRKARLERQGDGTYTIVPKPNSNYEATSDSSSHR